MPLELVATGAHDPGLTHAYEFAPARYEGLPVGAPVVTTIGWTLTRLQTLELLRALGMPGNDAVTCCSIAAEHLDRIDLAAIDRLSERAACPGLGQRLKLFLDARFRIWLRPDS